MQVVEAQHSQLEKDHIPFNWLPLELLIHIFVLATLNPLYPIQSLLDTTSLTVSEMAGHSTFHAYSLAAHCSHPFQQSDLSPLASVRPSTQIFLDRSKGIPMEVFCTLACLPTSHLNPIHFPTHVPVFPTMFTLKRCTSCSCNSHPQE